MNKKIWLSGMVIVAVTIPSFLLKTKTDLKSGSKNPQISLGIPQAYGDTAATSDSCFTAYNTAVASAPTTTYASGIIKNFHEELFRFNVLQPADIALIFCRLTTIMGVDPTLSSLPQTITKTDPLGNTIVVTVTTPTESFATTNGYTAKAVMTSNGTQFMSLWWDGSGTTSKGYLIQGSNPMETDGNTRLRYAMWDLTTSTQILKILATQFASSYLGSYAASATSKTGGDNAMFARLSYDTTSQALTIQDTEIRAQTVASTTGFYCVRTYVTGTLGGTVTGYRPATGTPEPVTETSTGGVGAVGGGMDGRSGLTDSPTTAETAGSAAAPSSLASGTFDHSCDDLDTATTGTNFSPFAGNTVSYTTVPTAVFPN